MNISLTKNNKVLIIAHDFPPLGGGGTIRARKIVKYLGLDNWQPIVLTVKEKYEPGMWLDEDVMKDLPSKTKIFRTASWELPENKYNQRFTYNNPNKKRIVRTLAAWLSEILLVPDRKILWLPFALLSGWKLIRKENIKLIFATTPPHSAQLVGLLLAKFSGLPLVADLRDDWVGNPYYHRRLAWRSRLEEKLEKQLIKQANKIILPTRASVSFYQEKYRQFVHKFVYLPNGYDEEDFVFLQEKIDPLSDKFVIGYMGQMDGKHNPGVLFQALRTMMDNGKLNDKKIEVVILGIISSERYSLIEKFNLEKIVRISGVLNHQQALRYMSKVNITLLIQNCHDGPNAIPGKTYEYMRLKKPIVALTDVKPLTDFIVNIKAGLTADLNDLNAVVSALAKFYHLWENSQLENSFQFCNLDQFNRKDNVKKLAKMFDSICLK